MPFKPHPTDPDKIVFVRRQYDLQTKHEWVGLKDEPVAWGMEKDGVILDVICPEEHEREEGGYTVPLYTTPQREYERGFIDGMQKQMQSSVDKAVNAMARPTYHIPSKDQREWVDLTKDEVFEIANFCKGQDIFTLAKELGRKLKERNT